MGKKVPKGDKKKLKSAIFILNVIISMLCVVAILGYYIMPLWEVKISVTLTPEIVEKYAPKSESSSDGDESSSEDMIGGILSSLSESDVKLEISGITLDTYSFVSAATGGTTEPVKKLIDSNINGIMKSLSDTIDSVLAPLMKSVVVTVVTDQVKKTVKEAISAGDNLDEETKKALDEMGFNEEYIDENIDEIIGAITSENATVESVTTTIMDVYDDVISKLESSSTYGKNLDEMTEEERAEYEQEKTKAHENVEKVLTIVLSQIATEDGSINMSEILSEIVLSALSEEESASEGESGEATAYAYSPNVAYADEAESENATEQLKAKLTAAIMEKLNDETVSKIAEVMKYIGYVILFTFFTWAYLILKIIVKLGAKNPGIKLKLPIWLGYIPFTILVLVPSGVIYAIKAGALDSVMGAGASDAKVILNAVNITFSSGAVFSFVCAIVLFVLSFFYGRYRRELKQIIRYERKNGLD